MTGGDASSSRRILPDGCIDLVWREGRLLIAGPDTGAWTSGVPPGGTVVGLRMRPGIGGSVLGLPASELRDARAEAVDVWGRAGSDLAKRVGEGSDPEGRRALLASALTKRLADVERTDSLVLAASRRLGFPGSRVTELADALGISDRQLRRRFHDAVGYGPKTLDRILRFQRFVARAPAVISGDEDLARIAADLGYADQAHLSRDSVRLSGLTPRELVESWTS
jgi:AraC-like DNA-binding protein